MGMDVYGKTENYFRNNVWWWRPLWDYVCSVVSSLTEKDKEMGHYNDGWEIDWQKAEDIAKTLRAEEKSGRMKKFADMYTAAQDSQPDIPCDICGGTGKRLEPPQCGPGDLPCNGCKSTGKVRPNSTHYPFSVENCLEFAEFCEKSGGFNIH